MSSQRVGQNARKELELLLSESLAGCQTREAEAYECATEGLSGAPMVLLGAGGLGQLIARIARENGGEVLVFCDNSQRLWGSCVDGLPVLAPDDAAARFGSSTIFIVTIWAAFAPGTMPERIQQRRDLGCRCVVPFQFYLWKHPTYLPYFKTSAIDLVESAQTQCWKQFAQRSLGIDPRRCPSSVS